MLYVCTHGAVDAACAKFGFPLYRELCGYRGAREGTEVRVWRVTHFGGHIFAPTLLELPAGRYWAYMEGDRPARLVARSGDVGDFYGHYRGWSGLDSSFLQAAEREVLRREGWDWLGYAKRGVTISQGELVPELEEHAWAQVRLEFSRPDGTEGAYEARVELGTPVLTRASTADEEDYPYPQYRVTRLNPSL